MGQLSWKGPSELDLVGQLSFGPYHTDMFLVHGFYLDLKGGYGWEGESDGSSSPGGRKGLVFAFNGDLPLFRTTEGLLSTNLVVGAQSLSWRRFGPLVGLRQDFYPSSCLVQATVGLVARAYDYDAKERWQWDRLAVMFSISAGPIMGGCPLKSLGVPDPVLLD